MTTSPDYSALDRAGASRTAFYPRPDHSRPPTPATDHLFEIAPGIHLGARLYTADPAFPTIIYFHGNGEVASDHDDISEFYFASGSNLLVIEFRGYGASNGHPTFENLVADARTSVALAHELLDGFGYGKTRFVMGRSMGAHSALEIAANAPEGLSGLILESGAGNLRRWIDRLDLGEEGAQLLAAHEAKLRSIQLPCLMIHGQYDELIPLATAREVYNLLESSERKMLVIPNAGHNDIVWVGAQEYFSAIAQFLRDYR
ncbi:MAG: alpha/beta hydrolase [Dehalococcoidia bacterium]